MRARSGCARGHCYPVSGRVLLGGAPQPQAADPPVDAHGMQLERAIAATTGVIFIVTVSYVAFSTIFACCFAGESLSRQQQPGQPPAVAAAAAAAAEETKRALQEIPVVVVQVVTPPDPAGCFGVDAGGPDDRAGAAEEPGECTVCLAEYAGGEEVRVLPACSHGFHRECIDRWLLTRAPTCPICRAPVLAAHAEGPDAKDTAAPGDAALALAP